MRPNRRLRTSALALALALGCTDASGTGGSWKRVVQDPNYDIYLDTVAIQRRAEAACHYGRKLYPGFLRRPA